MKKEKVNLIKEVIFIGENNSYEVVTTDNCVEVIMKEYLKSDVCMGELLACIEIKGFSIENVVEIYAKCIKASDGDLLIKAISEVDMEKLKQAIEVYNVIGTDVTI